MSGPRRVVAGGPPKAPDDRRQSLLLGWEPEPALAPVSAPESSAQERAALRAQVAASKQAFNVRSLWRLKNARATAFARGFCLVRSQAWIAVSCTSRVASLRL
jgi:hypothetical protein